VLISLDDPLLLSDDVERILACLHVVLTIFPGSLVRDGFPREGGFAIVYKVTWNDKRDQAFALKGVTKKQAESLARLRSEEAILKKLDHPSIVSYKQWATCAEVEGLLLSPWCEYSLEEYLSKKVAQDAIPLSLEIWPYFQLHLVSAVSYLHTHNIRHHDIKPANIMLRTQSIFIPPLPGFLACYQDALCPVLVDFGRCFRRCRCFDRN